MTTARLMDHGSGEDRPTSVIVAHNPEDDRDWTYSAHERDGWTMPIFTGRASGAAPIFRQRSSMQLLLSYIEPKYILSPITTAPRFPNNHRGLAGERDNILGILGGSDGSRNCLLSGEIINDVT